MDFKYLYKVFFVFDFDKIQIFKDLVSRKFMLQSSVVLWECSVSYVWNFKFFYFKIRKKGNLKFKKSLKEDEFNFSNIF